jgi:hypothetical protein
MEGGKGKFVGEYGKGGERTAKISGAGKTDVTIGARRWERNKLAKEATAVDAVEK